RGGVAYDALTPTTRSFGSRSFRVAPGDAVLVDHTLAGESGSARIAVSLCTYSWFRPDCEMLLMQPLPVPSQGRVEVAIPARGRCRVDLWVRDYTGGLTLGWDRRSPPVRPAP
ncbi:MAG: hypothetical protein ACYCYF_01165, partial [Anaerolineae bacterium]